MLPKKPKKKVVRAAAVVISILAFLPAQVGAAPAQAPAEFEYPELAVTPRASERLEMEAAKEQDGRWLTHLPIQFSALTSTVAGVLLLADKNPDKNSVEAAIAGISVGAGWILLTSFMNSHYEPYASAQKEIAGMPKRSQREQLLRERIAEERIEAAARVGRRLQWLSIASHLGVGAYMAANAKGQSAAMVAAGVTVVSAFTPLIFSYTWQQVANEQRNYKKRIYAPIASATILPEPSTGRVSPGLTLTFLF